MPPVLIYDPSGLDVARPIADIEAIRKINPQRYEMEQLTAILHLDPVAKIVVGYKDVRQDEFWARGHMPGFPIMPGVLICEAAAQLCGYYIVEQGLMSGDFVALGGLDSVKFRGAVRPGDRLFLVARAVNIRPGRRAIFNTQGIVHGSVMFHGDVHGLPFTTSPDSSARVPDS